MDEDNVFKIAERAWNDGFTDQEREENPLFFVNTPITEVAKDIYFKMCFGNITVIRSSEGLILVDCGIPQVADLLYYEINSLFPDDLIHTIIYTHGHIDHCGSALRLEELQKNDKNIGFRVVAHANCNHRFERYCQTCHFNQRLNQKQFVSEADLCYDRIRRPDLVYNESLNLVIGNVQLELFHNKGETDDATWILLPLQNIIISGDFLIWNAPNCSNPQKVLRYPEEWATTLRRMSHFKPELLLPGHGPLIIGSSHCQQVLNDTARYLEYGCKQAIDMINAGLTLNEIQEQFKYPIDLLAKPYLKPYYDCHELLPNTIWRAKAGFWTGELWNLRPFNQKELANELNALFLNKKSFINKILDLQNKKKYSSALFLLEMMLKIYPEDQEVLKVAETIYGYQSKFTTNCSSMVRNQFKYHLNQVQERIKSKL